MSDYFLLFVGTVLVNNFVLTRFLGLCPFLGVSRSLEAAIGMSLSSLIVVANSLRLRSRAEPRQSAHLAGCADQEQAA